MSNFPLHKISSPTACSRRASRAPPVSPRAPRASRRARTTRRRRRCRRSRRGGRCPMFCSMISSAMRPPSARLAATGSTARACPAAIVRVAPIACLPPRLRASRTAGARRGRQCQTALPVWICSDLQVSIPATFLLINGACFAATLGSFVATNFNKALYKRYHPIGLHIVPGLWSTSVAVGGTSLLPTSLVPQEPLQLRICAPLRQQLGL